MHFLNHLMNQNAYSLDASSKLLFFKKNLNFLTTFHYKRSSIYKNYLNGLNYEHNISKNLSEIPFLPVRLFKEFDFLSIKKNQIFKTLLSSGTTSNGLSKIYIDKNNALNQIKVLQKIFNNLIGSSRLPMLVVDKQNINLNRNSFNASAAAISGFSIFAKEIAYLLDQENNIKLKLN